MSGPLPALPIPEGWPRGPHLPGSPEASAAWLHRVGFGSILALAANAAGLVGVLVPVAWPSPPVLEAWRLAGLVFPPVQLVSAWLLSAPVPGDRSWLAHLRWAFRLAMLAWVATAILRASLGETHPATPGSSPSDAALAGAATVTQAIAVIALPWYLSRLARRLGDATLRAHFHFLTWLMVIVVGFGVANWLASVMRPEALGPATQPTQPSQPSTRPAALPGWSELGCIVGLLIPLSLWLIWLNARLYRLTRYLAEQLTGPPGGEGPQGF